MNFFIDNWILISIAMGSGLMLLMPVLRRGGPAGLAPQAVVQLINREKAVLIDICEPQEFAAEHLGNCKNIPLGELESKLPGAVKNKALPLVMVCRTGTRSARAVAIAKQLGYERAYSLAGGLAAWKGADLPTERS